MPNPYDRASILMRGRIFAAWECPSGPDTQHRLVNIRDLPDSCGWDRLKVLVGDKAVEYTHFFGSQALVQFCEVQDAKDFVMSAIDDGIMMGEAWLQVRMSTMQYLIPASERATRIGYETRVLCIQILKLRVYLGIHDIYDECSRLGTVEKIICFTRGGKYALVRMTTLDEASLVLANLTNNTRHLPLFQLQVQYSNNQDIVIKYNNPKSFDFTTPGAAAHFAQLREVSACEVPFFEPEPLEDMPTIFDLWRPLAYPGAGPQCDVCDECVND